jgi:hypothetical protein
LIIEALYKSHSAKNVVDEGSDLVAFLQQLLDRVPAGVACRPGDQDLSRVHLEFLPDGC